MAILVWPACQILLKLLGISSATITVALDLLKAIAIISDTTVRRSTVDREGLKPYWKSANQQSLLLPRSSKTLLTRA